MHNRLRFKHNSAISSTLTKIADVFLYLFAFFISFYQQFNTLQLPTLYRTAAILALLLLVLIFSKLGVYRSLREQELIQYLKKLYPTLGTLILVLATLSFVTKTGTYFSRAWFIHWQIYALIFLTVFRIILYKSLAIIRKKGFNKKKIIIIGTNSNITSMMQNLSDRLWDNFTVIRIFATIITQDQEFIGKIAVNKIPEDINNYIKNYNIDEVWFMLSPQEHNQAETLLHKLQLSIVTVRYFPGIVGIKNLNQSITEFLGLPVINIISSPMDDGINRFIKAFEDRILSLLLLILVSPVMLIITVLVKISSPGPVFYKQKRISWNNREFWMLKFRSMPINAEDKTGPKWNTKNDNRTTGIGTLLRKTSLDELPQFINVLKGNMSIVGPRPERPEFVEKFKHEIPSYMQKHLVKGGITGWAQINGWRGNTNLEKRIEHDLYYINHWSLWLDLKIIFLTMFKGFFNKNAY